MMYFEAFFKLTLILLYGQLWPWPLTYIGIVHLAYGAKFVCHVILDHPAKFHAFITIWNIFTIPKLTICLSHLSDDLKILSLKIYFWCEQNNWKWMVKYYFWKKITFQDWTGNCWCYIKLSLYISSVFCIVCSVFYVYL